MKKNKKYKLTLIIDGKEKVFYADDFILGASASNDDYGFFTLATSSEVHIRDGLVLPKDDDYERF